MAKRWDAAGQRGKSMKPLLLSGASLLAILAAAASASAATTTFSYTGAVVDFTAPTTGDYEITAYGAQGGGSEQISHATGGKGAEIRGTFTLTAGEILEIAVGGVGGGARYSGGGGAAPSSSGRATRRW
jgi:hypothetical protein